MQFLNSSDKAGSMLLNSETPNDSYTIDLANELSEKYKTTVIPINCLNLGLEDINLIFSKLLYEFMIERIEVNFPSWIYGLDSNNELKNKLLNYVKETFNNSTRLKEVNEKYLLMNNYSEIKNTEIRAIERNEIILFLKKVFAIN